MVWPASTGDRYLSGLQAGDCGLPLRRRSHVQLWWIACLPPSFGNGGRRRLSTLDALRIDRNFSPVNPGLFETFLCVEFQRACVGLLLPRPLGACRSTLRLFTGWSFLAVVSSG